MKRFVLINAGLCLLLGGLALTARAQQAPSASASAAIVPYSDPAYRNVNKLQKSGIVIAYPDGTYSGPPPINTPAKFAAAMVRLLDLLSAKPAPDVSVRPSVRLAVRQDLETVLRENKPALDALQSLVTEFSPELTEMGQDVPAVQSHLTDLARHPISPPFPDVPKTHWAYQAVEELRQAGIVVGESDGRFNK